MHFVVESKCNSYNFVDFDIKPKISQTVIIRLSCLQLQSLYQVDRTTDVVYTVSNAVGPLSARLVVDHYARLTVIIIIVHNFVDHTFVVPLLLVCRDFVSSRKIGFRDGKYYLSCKSIVIDLKPEQNGKVR